MRVAYEDDILSTPTTARQRRDISTTQRLRVQYKAIDDIDAAV